MVDNLWAAKQCGDSGDMKRLEVDWKSIQLTGKHLMGSILLNERMIIYLALGQWLWCKLDLCLILIPKESRFDWRINWKQHYSNIVFHLICVIKPLDIRSTVQSNDCFVGQKYFCTLISISNFQFMKHKYWKWKLKEIWDMYVCKCFNIITISILIFMIYYRIRFVHLSEPPWL